jgi:hypothetical protein
LRLVSRPGLALLSEAGSKCRWAILDIRGTVAGYQEVVIVARLATDVFYLQDIAA